MISRWKIRSFPHITKLTDRNQIKRREWGEIGKLITTFNNPLNLCLCARTLIDNFHHPSLCHYALNPQLNISCSSIHLFLSNRHHLVPWFHQRRRLLRRQRRVALCGFIPQDYSAGIVKRNSCGNYMCMLFVLRDTHVCLSRGLRKCILELDSPPLFS